MSIFKTFIFLISSALIPISTSANSLLRDADIENALTKLANPILQAAGLSPSSIKILLVNSSRPNAFIIDNKHIFITSGLALKTGTPEMLQSIVAHEAAHIAYGHTTRRSKNLSDARSLATFGLALGVIAGTVGGNYELGSSIALGASGSSHRNFLAHTRAEESAADQAAMSYMAAARIDGKGMMDVLDIFLGQENLSSALQDPYARSHPLTRDRKRIVRQRVDSQPIPRNNQNAQYWHARAVGKLSAFINSPEWTLKNAKKSSYEDIGHIRKAVAYSRKGKLTSALSEIDKALQNQPNDAYLQDLKAELLMRHKKFAHAAEEYKKASQLDPTNGLILAGYGRALLAANQTRQALSALKKSREQDVRNIRMLRDLAVAYSKMGENGMASLVTAERYALQGKISDSHIHAQRALKSLAHGSPGWQSAQDILEIRFSR